MIKTENGRTEFKGNTSILLTDATLMLRGLREVLAEEHDIAFADREIDKALKLSRMDETEISEEKKKFNEMLDAKIEALRKLMAELVEDEE